MNSNRMIITAAIAVFALALGIGSRWLTLPPEAAAQTRVQYRVVSTGMVNSTAAYEKLLNDMANQGWVFDHDLQLAEAGTVAVFRK